MSFMGDVTVTVMKRVFFVFAIGFCCLGGFLRSRLQQDDETPHDPYVYGVAAAPEAERVYEPTLAHLPPPAPEPINGQMVGIYTLRGEACAEHFVHSGRYCLHSAVVDKPETEASLAAYSRGSAPPMVRLYDNHVTWPPSARERR